MKEKRHFDSGRNARARKANRRLRRRSAFKRAVRASRVVVPDDDRVDAQRPYLGSTLTNGVRAPFS